MTATVCCARLVVGICAMMLVAGCHPLAIQAQEAGVPPNLGAVPEGLTVRMLASEPIEAPSKSGGVHGSLVRLPLDSGERMKREATGSLVSLYDHLIYVESGAITILTTTGTYHLLSGEQAFLAASTSYEILNDSGECASVLQLGAAPFGLGISSKPPEDAPNLPQETCGKPRVLLNYSMPLSPTSPPMSLFVAELTWASRQDMGLSGRDPIAHPGSVGLHVTSGIVRLAEPATGDPVTNRPIRSYLGEGSSVEIPGGRPYSASSGDDSGLVESGQGATALMAGVIPTGRELFLNPNETLALPSPARKPDSTAGSIGTSRYTSPTFGYSISWNPATWTVPEEAEYSEPGYDSLKLETDTGPIWVEGKTEYGGNVSACLVSESALHRDPATGISQWQVAVDANGNELAGSDENSAWGVFTNVYTDPENPSAAPVNFVDYINCVSMGDGQSVVIFYSYARREDYNDHIGRVETIVDSLQLPETEQ